MGHRVKHYRAEGIVVSFDPALCIHAARCVHGLPAVFDPQARPWIRPGEAEPAELAAVVARCPTGALRFERLDGGPAEQPGEEATVTVTRDGPLFISGPVRVVDHEDGVFTPGPRAALCRCGASRNRPFCDGSHAAVGFRDPASAPTVPPEP
jgi:uncharacterized Fe-S cluster protein YjdI/CDGSH-type Zn-finger protein